MGTRILIPSGALGLGYNKTALDRAVAAKPDLIAIDGGSTDSGPSYLGRGVSKYATESTKIEWQGLIEARATAGCPLVIGTAGTCGTDSTVDWLYDITLKILSDLGLSAKIARLYSEQDTAIIAQTPLFPLSAAPYIDSDTVKSCTHIVALAGAEQIQTALKTGAEIIIAGRTTDTAIIAALPLQNGNHAGAAWHGAKIGECGALCATNPQSGVILVDFDDTGFTVTPMADGAKASPHTVSAHMLYENSDPFILFEPGGHLDVTQATYTAINDVAVRVMGSKWEPSDTYTVKLEGARITGYQTILMAILRDAHYVENVQIWCDDIIEKLAVKVADRMELDPTTWHAELRIIGQNSNLGALEQRTSDATELGVLAILTAPDQATANTLGKMMNPYLLHHPLTQEEEQPTFAFPFSPAEIDRGAAYEFVLHHVMELANPMDAFRLVVTDV
ncbi:MAG: acyclic terpene utilization AtuA family protein [Octadecabacter sp.]|nr:acyclic terpene utilization AtuA family protein [Octadecabacter sp.]